MKKLVFIFCVVIAALFGCNGRKMTNQLEAINQMADVNPDSALTALAKYESEKQEWSKGDRMHFELVRLKAENKSEVTFKSDSIIKEVVEYFKENGTPNEKMLAYYLLGRTYFDMEEAPEALQAYYDAISSADTTSTSCDYSTLTVVYGQMSRIFHQQNLPHDEIWALKHYIEYIRRYESKKDYLIAKEQLIRPLYLLNEKDSVLQIINDTYSALKQMGEHQEAADAIAVSTYIYLERGELDEAKHAMDIFEKESGLFDKYGNITEGREHYYYTKA